MNAERLLLANYLIAYLFIFFSIFLIIPSNHDYVGNDSQAFIFGVQNSIPDRFIYPLLFWVTEPLYKAIGEPVFIYVPILLFAIAITFLLETFREFKLDYKIIGIALAINFISVNFLLQFMRDSLMFTLAAMWTYFFLKDYYKKTNNMILLGILTALVFLTRSDAGLLFVVLFLAKVVYNWLTIYASWKYIAASTIGVIPEPFAKKIVQIFELASRSLFSFDPKSFLLAFSNPVYIFTSFLVILSRDFLHVLIVLMTLFSSYLIGNVSFIFGELSFRYLFSLMPLHLFFLARIMKQYKQLYYAFIPLLLVAFGLFLIKAGVIV